MSRADTIKDQTEQRGGAPGTTLSPDYIIRLDCGSSPFAEAESSGSHRLLSELGEQFAGRDDEAILGLAAEEFDSEAKLHPERYKLLADWFLAEASLHKRPETVLDVGCGPGLLTNLVAEGLPDARVMGIDLSRDMLRLAERNNPDGRVCFVNEDARNALDVAERPVDALISRRMIHRVDDLEQVLLRMVRAVRPGGGVVLNYSFRQPLEERSVQAFADAARKRVGYDSLHAAFVRAVRNAPTLEHYLAACQRIANRAGLTGCEVRVFPFDVGIVLRR